MSQGNPGERDARWAKARAALAQVDELQARQAELHTEAPEMGAAARRTSDQLLASLEASAGHLEQWREDLNAWDAAAVRARNDRQTRGAHLIQRLRAAWTDAPDDLEDWVHTALNDSESLPATAQTEAPEPSEPPLARREQSSRPALPDPPSIAPAIAAIGLGAIGQDSTPPPPSEPVLTIEPDEVDAIVDGALRAMDDMPAQSVTPAPHAVAAQFNFSLHDMEPVSIPADDPPLFDFGEGPANDDLSTLQADDLNGVIDATPEPEIEDVSMGSLGLMDTSALSTEQVRAQLLRIRAERAAAEEAAAEEAAAEEAAAEEAAAEEAAVEEAAAEEAAAEEAVAEEAAAEEAAVQDELTDIPSAEDASPASIDVQVEVLVGPPDPQEQHARTDQADALVEPAVVEVESGPIAVLDVRELLGEPPERPSRIDAAIRAVLSEGPVHEPAPVGAAASAEDWLEATPTSHPPRSALDGEPAESIEIDLDGSEDLDSTVALQAQDLSAAMEAVADADDWLDVSQSMPGSVSLTSNQSLKAIADDDLASADPWDELDISAHGEIRAGQTNSARAPRAALNVNVGIEHSGSFFTARSDNISSAGMFVTCDQALPQAGRVDLFFEMPDGQSVAVQAQVSWQKTQGRAGYGLQFLELRYDDRVVIDRFVTAQAANR